MKSWAVAASLLLSFGTTVGAGDDPTVPVTGVRDAPAVPGAVQGLVRGADGGVVSEALVAAILYGAERTAGHARSGDGGRFRIENLPAGTYGLTVTSPGRAAAYLGGIDIKAEQVTGDVELSLGTGGITLSGRLRDPAGNPIRGGDVLAWRYSDQKGDIFQVAATQDGRFEITLPEGTYSLLAQSGELRSKWTPGGIKEDATMDLVLRPAATGPAPRAVSAWLKRNAVPIATPEAGHGFADLQPLRKMVGQARIVALGEATHGTREFFQLKHRMLEFLATEMGFTVFAIEASFPDALAVNDYVLEGKGDPAQALAGLGFWTWDTEEVLEMIRWMRTYNEDSAHNTKLKFLGFDMQNPAASVVHLISYLKRVDPEQAGPAIERLDPLVGRPYAGDYAKVPAEARKMTADWIDATLLRFSERKDDYVAKSSMREWALAQHHARLIHQAEETFGSPAEMIRARDRSMAENVTWILDHEPRGTKVVLWAHNGHVAADPASADWVPMGSHLRQAYGSSMVVIGFSFNQGSFRAMDTGKGLHPFTVGPAPVESLDAALATAGMPLLALDLRRLPGSGPVKEWFETSRPMRSIGAVFSEGESSSYLGETDVMANYDAILFVDKTTSAKPNTPIRYSGSGQTVRAADPAPVARNLDLEMGEVGKAPEGWTVPKSCEEGGYRVLLTEEGPRQGTRAARLDREGERRNAVPFGNLMQSIDAAPYRGRLVRFRAAVRAEVEGGGNQAQLWLRVDRPDGAIGFFDNMMNRPIVSPDWQEYEIAGEIAGDAVALNFGVLLVGKGRAWIDDASLTAAVVTGAPATATPANRAPVPSAPAPK